MIQGSKEWFDARLGKATASRISDIMAKTKSGPAASRKNYMDQLVVERLTGTVAESYTNAAMQWGIDNEAIARAHYEFETGSTVEEIGLVDHPSIPMSSASPDGLVEGDGLIEIKCPNSTTAIDLILTGKIPDRYMTQMMWQMACCPEREWCDFVSFDPRLPPGLQLTVQRVERDNDRIAELEEEVGKFLLEVDNRVSLLEAKLEESLETKETIDAI